MDFGKRLRSIREEAGISRRELQRRTGLSSSYLHYIEHDRVMPGDKNVRKIARALGMNPAELLTERERAKFEEQGVDGEASLMLRELGPLTDEERTAILSELRRVARQRKRRAGKASRKSG